MLEMTGCNVRHSLSLKINNQFRGRVGIDSGEQLCQERLGHSDRQNKIIQFVIAVDIGEKAAYHHSEPGIGNSPCGMLAA